MPDFSNYSAKSKDYDDSNVSFVGKMKDEMGGVVMKEFICLRPKIYSILVRDSNQSKKVKVVNKNVVAKISQNEYKNFCLRHSVNRIQSKNNRIRLYEISKFSLSCFDDKIYILHNRIDAIALDC